MIVIYSAPWCGYCKQAKAYFASQNIAYTDYDVDAEPARAEEAEQKSGARAVPVIDIDGEIIIGFDKPLIDQALKKFGYVKEK